MRKTLPGIPGRACATSSILGGTRLSCETRIVATDAASRRRFGLYWMAVQPGSSAIRWELLTAVALRAEARAG